MFSLKQRHQRKKKRDCDACDCHVCDCDGPDCRDLRLFSSLLTLGSVAAGVTRAPMLDRVGRAGILGYRRWVSHRWPGPCRFTPSCSAYGLTDVERYGLAVGGRMVAQRLRSCRPGVRRGTYDPVL